MKFSTLSIATLLALYPLAPLHAASSPTLALFAPRVAADLPGMVLVRGGGDDRSGRGGGDDHSGRGHDGDDDHDDDHHDDDDDHDDDHDDDVRGSGRDRPRIPGGSGCDDPGDILEHPECRP
jgi:hypothetical protein